MTPTATLPAPAGPARPTSRDPGLAGANVLVACAYAVIAVTAAALAFQRRDVAV